MCKSKINIQWLLSWLVYKWKVLCYQLKTGKLWLMFWLHAPVVIKVKVNKCEQTLLLVAMYYWGHVIGGQRLGRSAPPSLPPHYCSPAIRDFQSYISVKVIFWRCHLDMQNLLHHQLVSHTIAQQWCLHPLDQVVVLLCTFCYIRLLNLSPSQACRHLSVQSCHQSPSCLSNVDLTTAACDAIYHTGLFSQR